MPRVAVLVNGLPGSGKTTLGTALSGQLALPLLSKDVVKETLFYWIGVGDRDWSRKLGAASAEVLWAVLACCPLGALIEQPMGPGVRALIRQHLENADVDRHCEIWCDVPHEVAFRRFTERAPDRHPGHLTEQDMASGRPTAGYDAEPLGLGPVLRVPTDEPVDVARVAFWVHAQLDLGTGPG